MPSNYLCQCAFIKELWTAQILKQLNSEIGVYKHLKTA